MARHILGAVLDTEQSLMEAIRPSEPEYLWKVGMSENKDFNEPEEDEWLSNRIASVHLPIHTDPSMHFESTSPYWLFAARKRSGEYWPSLNFVYLKAS